MKLLFDQNLSPKLVDRLSDLFPDSRHVQAVGLNAASDDQIWAFAKLNGFTVVTKDEDYSDLSALRGSPPKIVWIQLGNCTTPQVETAFRTRYDDIELFEKDPTTGVFVLS